MDVELLSRIQFATTAAFHFLFPPISIGFALFIVFVEFMWLKTGDEKYKRATKFFLKLFGMIFAVGVVTGIIMVFQFGTNWPVYSRFVGDVFGSPLAIEAVFAFFMESTFLGVALWGWDKIGKKAHFFSTLMVCVGSHLSAIWILIANSFMQTPAGFVLEYTNPITKVATILPKGTVPSPEQIAHTRAVITDFWELCTNPSVIDRITHTISACWLSGAFLALGICAYFILRNRTDFAKPCAKFALILAFIGVAAMGFTGHISAKNLAVNQPEKLAAFEGHYSTTQHAPLYLIGYVDEVSQQVKGISLGGWLSTLAFGSESAEVKGLLDLPSDDFLRKINPNATPEEIKKMRPQYWAPISFSFITFRVMVGLAMVMCAMVALGFYLWATGKLFDTQSKLVRVFYFCAIPSVILPILASQVGWAAAEVGRQPWIVWHILKTSDACTTSATAGEIAFSTIAFTLLFIFISAVFLYAFFRKIKNYDESVEKSY